MSKLKFNCLYLILYITAFKLILFNCNITFLYIDARSQKSYETFVTYIVNFEKTFNYRERLLHKKQNF